MNKVEFTVARLGAEKTSPNFDSFLNDKIFCDLALRLCGKPDYKVTWTDERNKGRLIKADYKTRDGRRKTFITLSPSGRVKGRNSFFQSVATAFSTYIDYAQKTNARKCNFVFYILPLKGNYQTAYNNFIFKVMNTFGVNILNADAALKNFIVERFVSVRELIGARNSLRNKNAGNKSTYVTDEGKCYNIYGKTFGAN